MSVHRRYAQSVDNARITLFRMSPFVDRATPLRPLLAGQRDVLAGTAAGVGTYRSRRRTAEPVL